MKDEYDQPGWTPLLEASSKGRVDCIRALLKFKADPNVGCKENDEKPLHYAARGGHAQALTKLFKERAKSTASLRRNVKVPRVYILQQRKVESKVYK